MLFAFPRQAKPFLHADTAADAPPPPPLPPFGSRWYKSDTRMNVTVAARGAPGGGGAALAWGDPVHPRVLVTYLPAPRDVSTDGSAFIATLAWLSDGTNDCDPDDWADHKHCSCDEAIKETCAKGASIPACAHTSVNCLAGTGDFRIGIWDTSTDKGARVDSDGFAQGLGYGDLSQYLKKTFPKYRGYNFRIEGETYFER